MAREAIGRTYGLPVAFTIEKGEKAIVGRLLACNYLITVANSKGAAGGHIHAWSLNENDSRRHTDPVLITAASGFVFYNEDQNRHFEVHATDTGMHVSIIPFFGTNPPADQVGPTTIPPIDISDI